MATLLSIASGDSTTAATWGLVDSTSFVSSTETAVVLTTSRVGATTFTPGAITVAGIAVKLAVRTGTTGTMSVDLDQGGSAVAGTTVTINTADLPVAATADLNGGWHYFEFATPVTLLGATAYSVKCKTSSSSQISLFATSGSDWSRCLVTTTTQAPAAGDDMIVCGKYTGAGTSSSYTVTWVETATTDYGSTPTAANSLLAPGICVCNKGTLSVGTIAATNYNMKMSNSIIVYTGGTLNFGTTGTPMPRDSSFTLQFDCGANVDYGLIIRNLGTWNSQGLSRTSGKNIYYCKLNTDEAIASTSLGVDTDTGWLDNDEIAVASTTRTAADCEAGTLNGNAGASTLTVDGFAGSGGGLAAAHSGTSPTQAEVILLTRNVKVIGASTSLQGYVDIKATATVDCDWTEFKWLGSTTNNKRGIDIATTTGSCSFEYCALHDFIVSGSRGFNISAASGASVININYNVTWFISFEHITNLSTTGSQTITYNISIKSGSAALCVLGSINIVFTNNTFVGGIPGSANGTGLNISDTANAIGTFSNNVCHSNSGRGMTSGGNNAFGGVIESCIFWRNNTNGGVEISSGWANFTFNNCIFFGNSSSNIITNFGSMANFIFYNCTFAGDSTFSTANGFNATLHCSDVQFINCSFGVSSGIYTSHSTSDILTGIGVQKIKLINCILASSTEVSSNSSFSNINSYISSQKHDQTAGLHKLWKKYGTITIETTTVQAGTTSMKMTPNNASNNLTSVGPYGGFKVAVASGQTCTPTVYVYEDASYNGARATLVLLRNDAIGITADTVLDTATAASDAAWEALTGTTIAATDAGVMEFAVTCNGTSGNLFVDTFSAVVT
jgi:hypothetical protein